MSKTPLEVTTAGVPGQQTHCGRVFPLAYVCSTQGASLADAVDWARARARELTAQAARHGTVFFRGFPLSTAGDFDAFGASSICRSDVLWEKLIERCPEFSRACEEKGLKYTHTMPDEEDPLSGMGRSWKSTFSVETREAAEARMSELGYSWVWLANDNLRVTTATLPAVRKLDSGRKAFFNQLITAFTSWNDERNDPSTTVTFGDGGAMDVKGAQRAAELAEDLIFDVPWQPGDAALVDNYVTLHGRRTFQGTRRVLASFAASPAI